MNKSTKLTSEKLKALILIIRAGCSSAKEDLAILLYPIIRNIVGKYNKDPDDKTSTTNFIIGKIFKKLSYIDLDKSMLSYIKLIANNHCIDEYRRNHRKKRVLVYDNDYLDGFESNNKDNSLVKTDYLDIYSLATDGDLEIAEILYSIIQEEKPLEEVSLRTGKGIDELKKIQKFYIDYKLKQLLKKKVVTFS